MLDRLVKPYWPYLPEKFEELQLDERAGSGVPDDPLNYYFWYHLLEADDQGRQPNIDEQKGNKMFNLKSVSCLRQIAESGDKVEYIDKVEQKKTISKH